MCASGFPRADVQAALFGMISAELSASLKDSIEARVCTCSCDRTCAAHICDCPFFPDWTVNERMIRVGAHQGCCANTEGLWGIWRVLHPRAAYSWAPLCHAPFTHAALIALASFITFIASSLHCMLPGLVERSLWWRWRRCAHTVGLSEEQETAVGPKLWK